jgi:hypothetical protein
MAKSIPQVHDATMHDAKKTRLSIGIEICKKRTDESNLLFIPDVYFISNDTVFAFTRPIAMASADKPVTPVWRMALCITCVFLFLLNLTAKAEDDAAVIQSSIEAQLEAFRSGDAQRAFSFASDQIRDIFGTPENFIAMVRSQYAVMIAPASIVFLKLEHESGAMLQPVQLSDDRGELWLAVYSMQLDARGSWRINGCVLRRLHGNST